VSFVDLGQIRNESMKNPEDLIWIDVPKKSFFWSNYVTGIWIPDEKQPSNTPELNGMALTPLLGITDTGTSCSYIP